MSPRCTRRIGALGALALLLAACDTTVEPPAPPGGGGSTTPSTIAIALDRPATTVAAGASTQPVRVTLTRAGAATG
nr:hypothetical protein [Gemmatimonadaceae bacterium]